MLRAAPTWTDRLGLRPTLVGVRTDAAHWLRRWASAVAIVGLISGLGILIAAMTDLTEPTRSHAADQRAAGPPPIATYDPARGSAPDVRLTTPAQTRMLAVERRYQLAIAAQQITNANYQAEADSRHQALAAAAEQTLGNQTRIYQQRQHQQVVAAGLANLEQLRQEAAAAAAAAAQQQAQGLEPPAGTANLAANGSGGVMPIAAGIIGSRFGATGSWSRYHTGLDFQAAEGEPIHAAVAGTVVFAGNTGDWAGNHVAILHADGYTTMYSHLSWIGATVGERVIAGQLIGRVGETGRAFGPHLHFEVYPPGVHYGDVYRAIDPVPWLASFGVHPH